MSAPFYNKSEIETVSFKKGKHRIALFYYQHHAILNLFHVKKEFIGYHYDHDMLLSLLYIEEQINF